MSGKWAHRLAWPCLPLLLSLAACGSGGGANLGQRAQIECAPFARALTGVSLTGDAADWWLQARGLYDRSDTPAVGSILVLRRSRRLPEGHVAVVSEVLSARQITVTQANWVHGRVTQDQLVEDVSGAGDWSLVRVWWPPAGQMGVTDYPTFGFIRPDRPAGHDRLIAMTPAAIRLAEQGW
ncbi:MAG TPA: CHAP domain-containing protein [Rhodopila sp.]|uniref:CHAP domain-containing protein n=1 Tax=Rhodopila sp. TaxID=2480087 RepID=UPI002BE08FF3|nr:CHAP domain-containing protein [Rhodopila sp.]HVY15057.1 CHAP domain-containing protein [Rhodopila sp.]